MKFGNIIQMRHTVFSMNDEERFIGYSGGNHWNGWACPYFTRDEAERIVKHVNACSVDHNMYNMHYDYATDTFVYHDGNNDYDETFEAVCYLDVDTGEMLTLYAVGAFSWTWDDMMECETAPHNVRAMLSDK